MRCSHVCLHSGFQQLGEKYPKCGLWLMIFLPPPFNQWSQQTTSVSVRRKTPPTHTHLLIRFVPFEYMSAASSQPTLIWGDGCHGSGSPLLHSTFNSMDPGGPIDQLRTKARWLETRHIWCKWNVLFPFSWNKYLNFNKNVMRGKLFFLRISPQTGCGVKKGCWVSS